MLCSARDTFFYWRENTLMAVRSGPFKAHWVTRYVLVSLFFTSC